MMIGKTTMNEWMMGDEYGCEVGLIPTPIYYSQWPNDYVFFDCSFAKKHIPSFALQPGPTGDFQHIEKTTKTGGEYGRNMGSIPTPVYDSNREGFVCGEAGWGWYYWGTTAN